MLGGVTPGNWAVQQRRLLVFPTLAGCQCRLFSHCRSLGYDESPVKSCLPSPVLPRTEYKTRSQARAGFASCPWGSQTSRTGCSGVAGHARLQLCLSQMEPRACPKCHPVRGALPKTQRCPAVLQVWLQSPRWQSLNPYGPILGWQMSSGDLWGRAPSCSVGWI